MNTSHDNVCLGKALYKIAKRYGIAHKVGWVTCDNASNNRTMLQHFAQLLNTDETRKNHDKWDYQSRHIRCLAHIINLATQAFIGTHSKAPHYDPSSTDSLDDSFNASPPLDFANRDEIGLVCCVTVKTCSSAKQKALFTDLQKKDSVEIPRALLIDMKYLNCFLVEISSEESNVEGQRKLLALRITEEEWSRITELLALLKHADRAQQVFSSENKPCLSNGLPALEKLHMAWSSRTKKAKYAQFKPALDAGVRKIEEYYSKTSLADAYTMTMILDPNIKTHHFKKNWGQDLELDVRKEAEGIFQKRWEATHRSSNVSTAAPLAPSGSQSRLHDDSSDDDEPLQAIPPSRPQNPWLKEFNSYLDGDDELDKSQSVVSWWGINAQRYPTWASLARDYLAIMALSVSIEALQVLKSSLKKEVIFSTPLYTSIWELENEVEADDGDSDWEDEVVT
ncbi:hypothetical protein EST38_g13661 [Candolleomyces aberdarensis]|uniref:HAT C-terminal dimerisation domain-containing protein n=1 Tax=Candolleomyces aberdarensis TaxID=2316362 RepID=A0A4Q2CZD3_9AGAR|nr:hypothetical protein EST38_g13661 [Candolleomyces aberdarensis]